MSDQEKGDPAMELARHTGLCLGATMLPESLQGATLREANIKRAALLQEIANPMVNGEMALVQRAFHQRPYDLALQIDELAKRLPSNKQIDDITRRHLPDVPDLNTRISIALRLWAGYMDAAKVIAPGTRYEKNTEDTRQRDIPIIEAKAAGDPIYKAGVEAAPHLKHRVLGQDIFREGIPDGAIVLRDWDNSPSVPAPSPGGTAVARHSEEWGKRA